MVLWLLSCGADINVKNWVGMKSAIDTNIIIHLCVVQDGRTPLTEAIHNNHLETVKLLLDHGADIEARNNVSSYTLSCAHHES